MDVAGRSVFSFSEGFDVSFRGAFRYFDIPQRRSGSLGISRDREIHGTVVESMVLCGYTRGSIFEGRCSMSRSMFDGHGAMSDVQGVSGTEVWRPRGRFLKRLKSDREVGRVERSICIGIGRCKEVEERLRGRAVEGREICIYRGRGRARSRTGETT